MASVGKIINELRSAKSQLDAAKIATDEAGQKSEDMSTQAEGMELRDTVASLQSLHAQVEAMGERIAALGGGVDDLVVSAKAIREASPGRVNTQPAGGSASTVNGADAHNSNIGGVSPRGVRDGSGIVQPVRPRRSDPDPDLVESARKEPGAPRWRRRLLSTRTASIASAAVGGAATTTAGAMGHLPISVQTAFNTIVTGFTLWQVHKSNPGDEDEGNGEDKQEK